jgi:ribosome maturation protein SDO1
MWRGTRFCEKEKEKGKSTEQLSALCVLRCSPIDLGGERACRTVTSQIPVGQKLLTNVAIVRYKKGGEKFEIACYPNKVIPWRDGIEKDLAQVLQIEAVYSNVTSGKVANRKQLDKAFGAGVEQADILLEILKKGQLQTTQAERSKQSESLLRDIATIVADKCVNSETKRPFTVAVIETAMREAHYNLHATRSAKQQALTVIALLKESIPIERAQMRLHITVPEKLAAKLKDKLKEHFLTVELEEWSGDYEITGLIDPGQFRGIEELATNETKGKARVEVVDFSVMREGAAKIVDETKRTDADAATAAAKRTDGAATAAAADDGASDDDGDSGNNDDDDSDDSDAPAAAPAAPAPAAAARKQAAAKKTVGGKSVKPPGFDSKVAAAKKQASQKQRRTAGDRKRAGKGDDEPINEDDISL